MAVAQMIEIDMPDDFPTAAYNAANLRYQSLNHSLWTEYADGVGERSQSDLRRPPAAKLMGAIDQSFNRFSLPPVGTKSPPKRISCPRRARKPKRAKHVARSRAPDFSYFAPVQVVSIVVAYIRDICFDRD
jgi:hypothetical protein